MTDWNRLFHAYGVAEDTPTHLHDLVGDDAASRAAAVVHLHSAIIHQGTIFTATPAALGAVLDTLHEPVLRRPLPNGQAALVAVLAFIDDVGQSVADAGELEPAPAPDEQALDELFDVLRSEEGDDGAGWDSPLMDTLLIGALLELRGMAGRVLAAVQPFAADDADDVRGAATNVAECWAALLPGHA